MAPQFGIDWNQAFRGICPAFFCRVPLASFPAASYSQAIN